MCTSYLICTGKEEAPRYVANIRNFYQIRELKEVAEIHRFVGTAGTQCFATSAPFPFKTSTELQKEHKKIS
jgi:hypothetical protein